MDRIWNVWIVGQDVKNLIFAAPRECRMGRLVSSRDPLTPRIGAELVLAS
jgi:hypothetical protein